VRQTVFQLVSVCCALLLVSGCNYKSSFPPAKQDANLEVRTDDETAAEDENRDGDVKAKASEQAERASGQANDNHSADADNSKLGSSDLSADETDNEKKSDAAKSESENQPPPATVDVTSKRLLILTRRGPLIVDWRISVDGRSMHESVQAHLQQIFQRADTNGDGKATWQEVQASPLFQSGRLGNTMFEADADINNLLRRFDLNRNSLFDIQEAPRFLTGLNSGTDLFQLSGGSSSQRFSDSPLLELLDTDEDGVLSQTECQRAAVTLGNQDPNGDEILFPADISPLESGTVRSTKATDKAFLLDQRDSWQNVIYAIENHYARNYEFDEDSFLLTPGLLAKLDLNADRSIDKNEAPLLAQIAPHLILKASLGAAIDAAQQRLVFEWFDPVLRNAVMKTLADGSLLIDLHEVSLVVSVSDLAGVIDYGQQATVTLTALDTDGNGYLEEAEIEASPLGAMIDFELADADENNKLFSDEIAAFLREQAPGSFNRVSASVTDVADPVFHAVDKNLDRRLTAREIQNAGTTIWQYDLNQDGLVAADEFPEVIMLTLTRGSSQDFAPLPQLANFAAVDTARLPNWFLQMDRNGDQDISRNEFLGNPAQFAALDVNQNGFISADEIEPPDEEPVEEPASEDKSDETKPPSSLESVN